MTWTRFMDMHSGGGQKLDWGMIYIEAPEKEAEVIFQNRFGRNPNRVTCTCCGPDYSISEEPTLRDASAFERGCDFVYRDAQGNEVPESDAWIPGKGNAEGVASGYEERPARRFRLNAYMTLEEYIASGEAHFIYAVDIKPEERVGELHEEGYVWKE